MYVILLQFPNFKCRFIVSVNKLIPMWLHLNGIGPDTSIGFCASLITSYVDYFRFQNKIKETKTVQYQKVQESFFLPSPFKAAY